MNKGRVVIGDVVQRLRELPDESVQCVMTSPPYFGLRQYLFDGAVVLRDDISESERTYVIKEIKKLGITPEIGSIP